MNRGKKFLWRMNKMNLFNMLTVLLVALKLTGVISICWFTCFIPILVEYILIIIVGILGK